MIVKHLEAREEKAAWAVAQRFVSKMYIWARLAWLANSTASLRTKLANKGQILHLILSFMEHSPLQREVSMGMQGWLKAKLW